MERKIKYKKKYYKISEVASLLGVRTSVLRFWESEFPLSPAKTPGGQRVYTVNDIKTLLKIKFLLYEEKYTIEGARKQLAAKQGKLPLEEMLLKDTLQYVRKELERLLHDSEPSS
ncbi:MerR family transcriptional regulator [Candidatus Mcinerneyibacteriota bacterium]|nr:MerR family transcriptional regulator [Candidatus Mcinerneyibacteriota bacterium]